MNMFSLKSVLDKALLGKSRLSVAELAYLLSCSDSRREEQIFNCADRQRAAYAGNGVIIRGIIEFSNRCRNRCFYCGLNAGNDALRRYAMTEKEILESAGNIKAIGIGTVILQSGEDPALDPVWLERVIRGIKSRWNLAVTLSVGERSRKDYLRWRKAGADRYLLKIETTDEKVYGSMHPGMSFKSRINCLDLLRELGYQTGSGNIIGLPAQTLESIAADILFFRRFNLDMVGIGPFIPHSRTPLSECPRGDARLTLRALALARLIHPRAHFPATTALECSGKGNRYKSLRCGANVLMLNFTPARFRRFYEIYPGKNDQSVSSKAELRKLGEFAVRRGRFLDLSRGDALSKETVHS